MTCVAVEAGPFAELSQTTSLGKATFDRPGSLWASLLSPSSSNLGARALKSRGFGAAGPSKVEVSLQRGVKITKSDFSTQTPQKVGLKTLKWCPGGPRTDQSGPKRAPGRSKRSPGASILTSFGSPFRTFLRLRCQIGSRGLPGHPPGGQK